MYEPLPSAQEWLDKNSVSLDIVNEIENDVLRQVDILAYSLKKTLATVKKLHLSLDDDTLDHPEYKDGWNDISDAETEVEYKKWAEINDAYWKVENLLIKIEKTKNALEA